MKFICYKCGFCTTKFHEFQNHLKENEKEKEKDNKIIVIDTISLRSKL